MGTLSGPTISALGKTVDVNEQGPPSNSNARLRSIFVGRLAIL